MSGNWADRHGGGIYTGSSGTLTLYNTIVALNDAPTDADIYGSFTDNNSLVGVDPGFVRNPSPGADGVWGTADDDYGDMRLRPLSPAIDAGFGDQGAPDPLVPPTDKDDNPRYDDLAVGNVGVGTPNYVDIGAYERQSNSAILGDADMSGYVDDNDLSLLLANWGTGTEWGQGNFIDNDPAIDPTVNDDDLALLLADWNQGTPPPPPAERAAPPIDALLPSGMIQSITSPVRLGAVRPRQPEGFSNHGDYRDSPKRAYIPAVRINPAAPATSNVFDVSAAQPAAAHTIRRRTLTVGAVVRGKPRKAASTLFGVNLGDEFADILSDL